MTTYQTRRLRLRQWADTDKARFAVMSADAEVMESMPGVLDREQKRPTT